MVLTYQLNILLLFNFKKIKTIIKKNTIFNKLIMLNTYKYYSL